jgi:multicomponent Na+:H+ antiporter subunit E
MFFLYLLLWMILSMRLSIEVMAAGVIISAAVYGFACVHMRYKKDTDYKLLRGVFAGIRYAFLLLFETAKANIALLRIVFSRTIKIEPCIIYFRTPLRTNVAQVALANSITLTPGTVTVGLEDNVFFVHCLDRKFAAGIEDSVLVRQLQKIEGQADGNY